MIKIILLVSTALSQLTVFSPSELRGDIHASLGNFGDLQYGTRQVGKVLVAARSKTEKNFWNKWRHNIHGCWPLSWGDFHGASVSEDGKNVTHPD